MSFTPSQPERVARREPAAIERITLVARTPSPKPVAPPTPRVTPQPKHSLAPRVVVYNPAPRAAAPVHRTHGGKAAHLHAVLATSPPVHPRHVSLADNSGSGINNGGLGAGAGVGVGTGGDAGTGSGVGGAGNGNGGDTSTAPCGFVDFKPLRRETRDGQQYIWVQIDVNLRDGDVVVDDLQWPFVYAGASDNPWSPNNLHNPDFQMTMQPPPPDFDLEGRQKTATVFAVKKTGPDGYTLLDPCPGQPVQKEP